ncbi:MAG: folate family ECF transporter S component [Lachnospiraceae bacterium]|nr:folate family ECF transporter S component [Lachnospiraceae bacterium]
MKSKQWKQWKAMDLATMGLLIALNIIASKYLTIKIGDMYRVNFSSSFIMLSGIWLGSIGGAVVGLVSDLLGCVIAGYAINPLYTLMPVMIGVVSGLCEPIFRKSRKIWIYGVIVLAITIVASMFYGTWALISWPGSYAYGQPFMLHFPGRVVQGLITTVMNTIVVYMLYNSQVTRMVKGN